MAKERFIPERIKILRESKGISQDTLGEAVGCSRQAIQQFEAGQKTPRIDTLQKIAEYFDARVGFFFLEERADGR